MKIREKIEALKNMIRQNPKNFRAYSKLGSIYLRAGNINGSIQAYQRSIRINPREPRTLNGYGEALWVAKRFPEALKVFKKALKINKRFPLTHMNLSKAFDLVGDTARAIFHARFAERAYRKNNDPKGMAKAKNQLKILFEKEMF
jgi:tetratricopeptide (TPR) repeat protein